MPKTALFAVNGALGCLLGALLGEIVLAFLLPPLPPPPPPGPPVDILFTLDVTSSMQEELDGVVNGIDDFTQEFAQRNIDARAGLIAFGDRANGEEPILLSFDGTPFTADPHAFRDELAQVRMVYGGDIPESSFDALAFAAQQSFRPEAKKVIVLITDAPPRQPDVENFTAETVTSALKKGKVDQLHLVIQKRDEGAYQPFQLTAPGRRFLLSEVAGERSGFERLLPEIGASIAQTVGGVSSARQFATRDYWRVVIVSGLWTGLLAAGVALSLIVGQNYYTRRPLLSKREAWAAVGGGMASGVFAGSIAQVVFSQGGNGAIGRIVAWAVAGALVGWGVAFFVPNLNKKKAAWGGAKGGACGAIAFMILTLILGETSGRLGGAMILGAFIGLILALVELQSRRFWLEVARNGRENWAVGLGSMPLRVGSNELCEVYVRGVDPVELRFLLQDKVICESIRHGSQREFAVGEQATVGNLNITLRSSE